MMLATSETPARHRKRHRSESPLGVPMEPISPDPAWTWSLHQALASRKHFFDPYAVLSPQLRSKSRTFLLEPSPLPERATGRNLYSPDVLGHVMTFLGPTPTATFERATVPRSAADWSRVTRLRAVCQLWDTSLGHYLELRVVPVQTEVDSRGRTCWRPSCPAVLFQVLLHVGNGITERFHREWLQELRVDFDIGADRVAAIGVLTSSSPAQGLKSLTLQFASGADDMQYLEQLSRFASLKKIHLQRSSRARTRTCRPGCLPEALRGGEAEDDTVPQLEELALNDCRGIEARLAIALAPGAAPNALSASLGGLRSLSIYDPLPQFRSNAALEPLLGRLAGLREIHLFHLDLAAVPDAVFRLTGLEHLDCSYNRLQDLPSRISSLQQLQRISAGNNQISSLPDEIGDLPHLRELRLGTNRLERLPEKLCELGRIEFLELFENRLQELPAGLGKLSTVRHLNVRGNELRELPETIGQLASLEELRLDNNHVSALPNSLGSLQRLVILSICSCKLLALPDSVCSLQCLQMLLVSRNQLRCLPAEIGRLGRLRRLEASYNQLHCIPDSASALPAQAHLVLVHNLIEQLPASPANGAMLESISLLDTPLRFRGSDMLQGKHVELPESPHKQQRRTGSIHQQEVNNSPWPAAE